MALLKAHELTEPQTSSLWPVAAVDVQFSQGRLSGASAERKAWRF